MVVQQSSPISVFCWYTHENKKHLERLKTCLITLQRQNVITTWDDGDINAGQESEQEIEKYLDNAKIILLLISYDFFKNNYSYGKLKSILERSEQRKARVIPVLLYSVYDWENLPSGELRLGKLKALPENLEPVTKWKSSDDAWYDVTKGIAKVADELRKEPSEQGDGSSPEHTSNNGVQPPNPPGSEAGNEDNASQEKPKKLNEHLTSRRTAIRGIGLVAGGGILALSEVWTHSRGANAPSPGPTRVAAVTASPTSSASPTPTTTPTPLADQPLNIYQGHTDYVRSIAWASNGYIASGSYDKTVHVWAWYASKASYIYSGHSAIVESVAWSSDGKYIASASRDRSVQVWNALSGATLVTYKGHGNEVYTVAYSPNGQYIASGGLDKTVQIHTWNATTADIFTYKGHTYSVYAVAWSPNGSYVASADSGGNVHVWDFRSGEVIFTYKHENDVNSVVWSPDGSSLASGSNDTYTSNSNTLQVWKMNSIQQLQYSQRAGTIYSLRWSPKNNGHLALAGATGVVQIWDNSGNKISSFEGLKKNVLSVAWSPKGSYIASGGEDKTVLIWSAN